MPSHRPTEVIVLHFQNVLGAIKDWETLLAYYPALLAMAMPATLT